MWRFSPRVDLAKQFLVDLVGAAPDALRASELFNLPTFPRAIPDLRARLLADRAPAGRYGILADAERWSAGPGHPGYASAAIDEVSARGVIPRMVARAVRGEQSAEDAVQQAHQEMTAIFARLAG